MSVEIRARIICDQCGDSVLGPIQRTTTNGLASYWIAKQWAKRLHWMFNQRYGTTRHLCQACADSVPAAVKK